MTRRPLLLLALVLAATALPGCGGEESAARARDGRVAVRIDDFRYTPQQIRAAPGRLRFDFVNRGRLAHTFRLERGEDQIVAKVSSLLPGDRARKTVRVRKGTYRFFCALSNHEELGMYGTLVVR
jgi:plastocyanin